MLAPITVDKVLAGFQKTLSQLDKVAEANNKISSNQDDIIAFAKAEKIAADAEADKAVRVRAKLAELFE